MVRMPVAVDADEGVRCEFGIGRLGIAAGERQAQTDHQAAAGGRAGLKESASGESDRRV
jgi:hypothetical protein